MLSDLELLTEKDRIEVFRRLLKYPEIQEDFKSLILSSLVEWNVFQRIKRVEEYLGENEEFCITEDLEYKKYPDLKEERIPLLPLEERFNKGVKESTEKAPKSITASRVDKIIEALEMVKPRPTIFGLRYLTSTEIGVIISNFKGDLKLKGTKNPRQVRKELMEKVVEADPKRYRIGQSKNGKKILRIEIIEN